MPRINYERCMICTKLVEEKDWVIDTETYAEVVIYCKECTKPTMITEIAKAYKEYDNYQLLHDGKKLILYFWNGEETEDGLPDDNIYFELTREFEAEFSLQLGE